MEQLKYKVIAICGEAGSGKDSLASALTDQLQDEGYKVHKVVTYTTRPKRDYEIEGIDYHYVDNKTFSNLIIENKMLEVAEFNNWIYGTCIDDLQPDYLNIEVLNPEGIESMSLDSRIDLCIVQCMCNESERIIRQLRREFNPDVDEIFRRLKTDRIDFSDFHPSTYSSWNTSIDTDIGLSVSEEAVCILDYVKQWAEKDNE